MHLNTMPRQNTPSSNVRLIGFLTLIGICILMYIGYTYRHYAGLIQGKSVAQIQQEYAVTRVGELMIVPEEAPVLAEVKDPENLKKQQLFFKDVIAGDLLLIYPGVAKAVLYSPSRDILVNVGPVTQDQARNAATTQQTARPTQTSTITATSTPR